MRGVPLLFLLGLLIAAPVRGQTTRPVTPGPGSPLRKAVVDALRPVVGKELGKKPGGIVFRIEHLKVQNGWAFLRGTPLRANGKRMDYRGTRYEQALREGMFDDGVVALLRRQNGRWRVIASVIGATDVPYEDWDRRYKAPRAIFR